MDTKTGSDGVYSVDESQSHRGDSLFSHPGGRRPDLANKLEAENQQRASGGRYHRRAGNVGAGRKSLEGNDRRDLAQNQHDYNDFNEQITVGSLSVLFMVGWPGLEPGTN